MAANAKKNGRHSAEGQREAKEAKRAQAKSNLKRLAALSFDDSESEQPAEAEPEQAPEVAVVAEEPEVEPAAEEVVAEEAGKPAPEPEPVEEPKVEEAVAEEAEPEPETEESVAEEAAEAEESEPSEEPVVEESAEEEPESTEGAVAELESGLEADSEPVEGEEPAAEEAEAEAEKDDTESEAEADDTEAENSESEAEADDTEAEKGEPEAEVDDEQAQAADAEPAEEPVEKVPFKERVKEGATKLSKKAKVPGKIRGERPSLFKRIFLSLAIVSAVTSIIVLLLSTAIFKSTAIDELSAMLENECTLVKSTIHGDSQDVMRLANLQMGEIRLTYLDANGECLYDNQNNIENVANQAKRPEVIDAINTGAGAAERVDDENDYTMIYRAIRLDNGGVIRLAAQKEGTASAMARQVFLVVLVAIAAILISWLFARIVSARLMRRIFEIDPENPEETSSYLELEPLVNQITNQKDLLGEAEEIDLRKAVSNVAKRLRPAAKDAKIKLTCSGSSAVIEGMPHMIENLIFNLGDNAIRYNVEDGHVRIWTGIEDDKAVLRVTDDGAGIPEDELARVFERFYQTELGQENNTTGKGLGLSVVKQIAETHGAELELESEEGSGTTVTLRFNQAH